MFDVGLAEGVQERGSLRSVAGDHEQETPPDPDSGVELPAQMAAEPEATAIGGACRTVTVALAGLTEPQPSALVTTNE